MNDWDYRIPRDDPASPYYRAPDDEDEDENHDCLEDRFEAAIDRADHLRQEEKERRMLSDDQPGES